MWKERYRKANDEIPLNEELLGTLLKTAEKTEIEKKHYGFGFGAVAAAAIIGIGIFSYSHLNHNAGLPSGPVADSSEPKAKLVQESTVEPSATVIPETEQQTVVIPQQPAVIVAPEEAVTETTEKTGKENEDIANIPAMASALTPRTIPSDEQSEELPVPEFDENEEVDVADETTPSVEEEKGEEPEIEAEEESVEESPTPTPIPESEEQ